VPQSKRKVAPFTYPFFSSREVGDYRETELFPGPFRSYAALFLSPFFSKQRRIDGPGAQDPQLPPSLVKEAIFPCSLDAPVRYSVFSSLSPFSLLPTLINEPQTRAKHALFPSLISAEEEEAFVSMHPYRVENFILASG